MQEYPNFRAPRQELREEEDTTTSAPPKRSSFGAMQQRIAERWRRSSLNTNRHAESVAGKSEVSDTRLVTLVSPDATQDADGRTQSSLRLPIASRQVAASARSFSPAAAASGQADASDPSRQASLNRMPGEIIPGTEPVRLVDPPLLRTPPTDGRYESTTETEKGLVIGRMLICRQVRGFEDVVELDASRLRNGQPILIYATLDNFLSLPTSKGYRTLTLSTLEVSTPAGEVVQRQPLGTAVDLVDVPRRDFFLTHLVTIPDNLPAGDYAFELCVDDLLGHASARARIAVRVTGDRTPRDGMADTLKSATRPASFQR